MNKITVLEKFVSQARLERIRKCVNERVGNVQCVLEQINQSSNIGAVLRTMDCFGIQSCSVVGKEQNYQSCSISKGADNWISISHFSSMEECFSKLQKESVHILASDLSAKSQPLSQIPTSFLLNYALVFGNEQRGISEYVRANADFLFYLPMYGMTKSMNISTAVASVLATFQNMNVLRRESLSNERKQEIYLQMLMNSVPSKPFSLIFRFERDFTSFTLKIFTPQINS